MTALQELSAKALELAEPQRARLALRLLQSLPAPCDDADGGLAEARRRDAELDANPSAALTPAQFVSTVRAERRK